MSRLILGTTLKQSPLSLKEINSESETTELLLPSQIIALFFHQNQRNILKMSTNSQEIMDSKADANQTTKKLKRVNKRKLNADSTEGSKSRSIQWGKLFDEVTASDKCFVQPPVKGQKRKKSKKSEEAKKERVLLSETESVFMPVGKRIKPTSNKKKKSDLEKQSPQDVSKNDEQSFVNGRIQEWIQQCSNEETVFEEEETCDKESNIVQLKLTTQQNFSKEKADDIECHSTTFINKTTNESKVPNNMTQPFMVTVNTKDYGMDFVNRRKTSENVMNELQDSDSCRTLFLGWNNEEKDIEEMHVQPNVNRYVCPRENSIPNGRKANANVAINTVNNMGVFKNNLIAPSRLNAKTYATVGNYGIKPPALFSNLQVPPPKQPSYNPFLNRNECSYQIKPVKRESPSSSHKKSFSSGFSELTRSRITAEANSSFNPISLTNLTIQTPEKNNVDASVLCETKGAVKVGNVHQGQSWVKDSCNLMYDGFSYKVVAAKVLLPQYNPLEYLGKEVPQPLLLTPKDEAKAGQKLQDFHIHKFN